MRLHLHTCKLSSAQLLNHRCRTLTALNFGRMRKSSCNIVPNSPLGMVCMGTVGSWALQHALLKAGKSTGNSHSSFTYDMSEQYRRASVSEACTSLLMDAS